VAKPLDLHRRGPRRWPRALKSTASSA